jgi:3-oxoacyl-[acyl-carrier-protein] synthase II
MLMPNGPAANIGLMVGAKAPVSTPVSACASGNEGISMGIDMIRLGRADVVLVGGTEAAVHPLPMAAFANMMALSKRSDDPTKVSRPWDCARDGFLLGEGAGILVLESLEHAQAAVRASMPRQPAPASRPTATTSPSRTRWEPGRAGRSAGR